MGTIKVDLNQKGHWKHWWESELTWSVSVFNGEAAHCPFILKRKNDKLPTSTQSRPAIRGTLVHDFFELLVKKLAVEAVDLEDYVAIDSIIIEAADKKGVGNDVYDEARDMIYYALENDILGDLNFEDDLGVETGIALSIVEDDESGLPELKVIDWDEGWEYDATPEEKAKASAPPFFRGKIDRFALRKEKDGITAYIIDYKTTLAMEDEETFKRLPNGKMYSWLLDKFLREKHDIHVNTFVYRHVFLRYHNAKKGIIVESSELEEIEEKILQRIENRINRMCDVRLRGPFCKYCGEQENCTEGSELDIPSMDNRSVSHKLLQLQNQQVHGKLLQSQAEKEIKKLLEANGNYVATDDFEFFVQVKPEYAYDFTPLLILSELGKEVAAEGTVKGKPITVNDLVQIKPSSCNDRNMPNAFTHVATPQLYKEGRQQPREEIPNKKNI